VTTFSRKTGDAVAKGLETGVYPLDHSVQIFPATEEALPNLLFTFNREQKEAVRLKLLDVWAKRKRKIPCVPFELEDEFEYNPFFRVFRPEIYSTLGMTPKQSLPHGLLLSLLQSQKEDYITSKPMHEKELKCLSMIEDDEERGLINAIEELTDQEIDHLEKRDYEPVLYEGDERELELEDDEEIDLDDLKNNPRALSIIRKEKLKYLMEAKPAQEFKKKWLDHPELASIMEWTLESPSK